MAYNQISLSGTIIFSENPETLKNNCKPNANQTRINELLYLLINFIKKSKIFQLQNSQPFKKFVLVRDTLGIFLLKNILVNALSVADKLHLSEKQFTAESSNCSGTEYSYRMRWVRTKL